MRKKLILTLGTILFLAYGALLATVISGTTPTLGLDLQGGVSVTQEPKEGTTYSSASLDLAVEKIRERVDSLGVAEPEILRQGDTIVVNLPGVTNQAQAIELVQVTGQVFLRPVYQCSVITPPDPNATTTTVADGTTTTVAGGTTTVGDVIDSPSTTAAGGPARPVTVDNSTTVAPSTTEGNTATTVAGGSTSTTEVAPTTTAPAFDENGQPIVASDPYGYQQLRVNKTDQYCLVMPAWNPDGVDPIEGTGAIFTDEAEARVESGEWVVAAPLRGGAAGEDVWNSIAAACYDQTEACPSGQISVELDGELKSVATMQARVFTNGVVQISGGFGEDEARDLARVMNGGALPVQLQLQSVQNVSPTLGKDSLRAAWISGLVGIGLVLLFMIFYYRVLGFIVLAGLTVSGAILWSVISLLSQTQGLALSLSGIAGIIVSVGVTVDSYVVFFERLKDEVRAGKTLRNSAQRGFTAAWRTIVIADLVSLIGAFVLWYLTVGSVRGFAFFLGLSTACDMVVAYFFTRPTVLLLARTKWMERRKVMGIEVATAGGAS
ncbi:MAG: protein translocase subunit SecD [Actinomycetota bacterium]|nr:protein translocase subunit SecD [Actinomycetota bacterium]